LRSHSLNLFTWFGPLITGWTRRPQSVTILTGTFGQAAVKFRSTPKLFLLTLSLSSSLLLIACQKQESPPVESKPIDGQTVPKSSDQVHLSKNAVRLAGIESVPVQEKANLTEVKTTGQIKADENRVFHINSLVPGRIVKDNAVLGKTIKAGDLL